MLTYGWPGDFWPDGYWAEYWPDYGEPVVSAIVPLVVHHLKEQGIS